jgi:hypothetical protein
MNPSPIRSENAVPFAFIIIPKFLTVPAACVNKPSLAESVILGLQMLLALQLLGIGIVADCGGVNSRLFGLHFARRGLRQRRLRLRLWGAGGRAAQGASAALVTATDGGEHAGFSEGEGDHLLHDPQNQFGAGGDVEFLKEAVQVGVRRVLVHVESGGDPLLCVIIKDALDDLDLALGDAQRLGDLGPSVVAEDCGSEQFPLLN